MKAIDAYDRFATMTDRRFCPLEEVIGDDWRQLFEPLQVDPWAGLMVAFCRLSGALDRAKTDKDLRNAVKSYEGVIMAGDVRYEECRQEAFDVLSKVIQRTGRPFATHEIN